MDYAIEGTRRDEIARILEQVAKEGLDHPRNLDAAIDAIGSALQGYPIMRIIEIGSGEEFLMKGHETGDAEDAFGMSIIVLKEWAISEGDK